MNLASIAPPPAAPAAPAATTKASADGGKAAGAAGFLAVLATKFAATGSSGSSDPASAGATGEEEEGLVAQDLLTLAALASRTASAALPQAVPVTALPVEGDADDGAPIPIDPDPEAATPSADTGVPAAGDLHAGSALVVDVPAPPDELEAAEGVVDDRSSPEASGARSEDAGDGPVTGTTVDEASPSTSEPVTTDQPATEPATAPRPAAARADAATEGGDDLTRQRAVPATPADRGRGRAEAPAATRIDGAGTVRAESVGASTQAAPASAASAVRIDSATPSAAAQRVLDLVTQLEEAPPPRVVVIDTGEIRIRLGLDAGTVRMTVLGPLGETGEELLREAADALEAGGFGTELDRGADGEQRGGDGASREDRPAPATPSSGRPAARSRAGLQL